MNYLYITGSIYWHRFAQAFEYSRMVVAFCHRKYGLISLILSSSRHALRGGESSKYVVCVCVRSLVPPKPIEICAISEMLVWLDDIIYGVRVASFRRCWEIKLLLWWWCRSTCTSFAMAWRKNVLMTSHNSHRKRNETEMHIRRNGFNRWQVLRRQRKRLRIFNSVPSLRAYPEENAGNVCFTSDGAEAKVNDLPSRRMRTNARAEWEKIF